MKAQGVFVLCYVAAVLAYAAAQTTTDNNGGGNGNYNVGACIFHDKLPFALETSRSWVRGKR